MLLSSFPRRGDQRLLVNTTSSIHHNYIIIMSLLHHYYVILGEAINGFVSSMVIGYVVRNWVRGITVV